MTRRNNLGALIALHRQQHSIGIREAARDVGVSHATLSRVERGYDMSLSTWLAVQQWLLAPAQPEGQ